MVIIIITIRKYSCSLIIIIIIKYVTSLIIIIVIFIIKGNNNFYYKYINSNEIQDEFILDTSNQKIEKDNYNIKSLKQLIIDKITGNFISVYFDDFLNIISVLIFDRGFSLNQEKKSNTQVVEDLKKYKPK